MNRMKGSRERAVHLIVLTLLSSFFFFAGLGDYSLKEPDEGRYAEIPREMIERGDWTVPYFNYVRYFEKPPFLYWMTALSFKTFGLNEWAFRFPNALCALLTVFLVYMTGSRLYSRQAGFASAVILCSSFAFLAMSRIVTLDMCFAFLLSLALCALLIHLREGHRLWLAVLYLALACATLTKGPVAIILLGGSLILLCCVNRTVGPFRSILWAPGIALYFMATAPWFVAMALREKEFLHFFFVDQHFLRFLTTQHKRSGPLYYFIPILLGGFLPWSVFLPRAVASLWRSAEVRLLLIWSVVVFVFFSASGSKLPPYILPVFPALSLVIGYHFARLEELGRPLAASEIAAVTAVSALLALAGLYSGFFAETFLPQKMTAALKLPSPWWSLVIASAIALLWASSLPFFLRRRPAGSALRCAVLPAVAMAFLLVNIDVVDRVNTSKRLSSLINENRGWYDEVINLNSFEESVPFYTRSRITLAAHKGELAMGAKYDDASPYFISLDEFLTRFRSHERLLVVLGGKILPALEEKVPGRVRVLGCEGDRCLVAND